MLVILLCLAPPYVPLEQDLGEFDRALGVVRLMVDDEEGGGLQPDAVTYTSLIKAAARASPPRVEEAEEVGQMT